MLDRAGHVVRSERISAKQGTVVTNPDGGCSMLVSMGFNGKDNRVYLLTLSEKLAQLNRAETPLVGWGGQSYRLINTPHGHLLVGEGPAPNPQKEIPKVIAEFDRSDRPIWQQEISSDATPLLIPFRSRFYLLRNRLAGKSTDVEKYLY
jgi:hypothetical protein